MDVRSGLVHKDGDFDRGQLYRRPHVLGELGKGAAHPLDGAADVFAPPAGFGFEHPAENLQGRFDVAAEAVKLSGDGGEVALDLPRSEHVGQLFDPGRRLAYPLFDQVADSLVGNLAEKRVPGVAKVRQGTVEGVHAFGHGPGEVVLSELDEVLLDLGGVFADLGGDAPEGEGYAVAFAAGLDAEFFQPFELSGGGIGDGFDHLVQVFTQGARRVAVAGQGFLGRGQPVVDQLDERIRDLGEVIGRLGGEAFDMLESRRRLFRPARRRAQLRVQNIELAGDVDQLFRGEGGESGRGGRAHGDGRAHERVGRPGRLVQFAAQRTDGAACRLGSLGFDFDEHARAIHGPLSNLSGRSNGSVLLPRVSPASGSNGSSVRFPRKSAGRWF